MVTLSTCESELVAMGVAAQEGRFVANLLGEMGISVRLKLYSDSSAARAVVARRGVGRLKHLEVRQLWLQDAMRNDELTVSSIPSAENTADLFTKAFPRVRHEALAQAIGLAPWHEE